LISCPHENRLSGKQEGRMGTIVIAE